MIHDTLQSQGKDLPLISLITPVYNTQNYVITCIESVLKQTYQNFEMICVDDGSTDRSAELIARIAYNDPRIRLIRMENHGQGYERNLAMNEAKGEYILFLDSDDYLEPVALDLAVTRAEEDGSDFVVFDWKTYNPVAKTSNYSNLDSFFTERVLNGEDCLILLQTNPVYTVNKLFRRSFLNDKNILFADRRLYEDQIFWFKAVMSAEKVSLIPSPLYRITINSTSSTRVDCDTDIHYKSYLCAVHEVIDLVNHLDSPINERARYALVKYLLEKFILYYFKRTPLNLRKEFVQQFLEALSQFEFQDFEEWKLLSELTKYDVFKRKDARTFKFLLSLAVVHKPAAKRIMKKAKEKLKRLYARWKNRLKRLLRVKGKPAKLNPWRKYNSYLKQTLYPDVILFAGFDFRYTGNSRYLFEEMLRQGCDKKLFFVTNDPLAPFQHRVEPNSDRYARMLARARVVVFESWIPANYKKQAHAIWVQLWHGTPLKRMLFDSNQKALLTLNPNHNLLKFKDIARWDYLLVDNPNIKSFFQTAFLFPPEKMLEGGYPRVKYLLERKDDSDYKKMLKSLYDIPLHKKVILYLPTWRDYNYRMTDEDCDTAYALDIEQLQALLGKDYFIIRDRKSVV